MDKEPTKIGMWEIGEDVQAMIDCLIRMGADWNGEVLTGGDIKTLLIQTLLVGHS